MTEISICFGIFRCKFMEISKFLEISTKQYGIVSDGIFSTRFPEISVEISSGTQSAKHHFRSCKSTQKSGFMVSFLQSNSEKANRE